MKNLEKNIIPAPKITSSAPYHNRPQCEQNAQYLLMANNLLKTISLNQENIREWSIVDYGATSHFLLIDALCNDVRPALIPLTVCQADGAQVHSLHTCSLRVKNLPQKARITHVIPGIALHSLLSVV